MRIGFDAKRLFFNRSGLGNYSRSTVELLSRYVPQNQYILFTPRHGNIENFPIADNMQTALPGKIGKIAPSLWRSYFLASSLRKQNLDIYHGLSNELPHDIKSAKCKSVVTIHDLIFVRYPQLYKPADAAIYKRKYGRSCQNADKIIAISRQTANDLQELWHIPSDRIEIVYQGCNPMFYDMCDSTTLERVKTKYKLPERYILSVGTVEERKNLMQTVMAMVEGRIDIDLVVCGRHTPYADKIMEYAVRHKIDQRIHWLHGIDFRDLPAIYQLSRVLVYTSIFEGFGIPILEGLNSRIPVITTEGGVFPETGGDSCIYVNPRSTEQMIDALEKTICDTDLRKQMIGKGITHVQNFREDKIARNLMNVYDSLL